MVVTEGVRVGVAMRVNVPVGVAEGVFVTVRVNAAEGISVTVRVNVADGVGVSIGSVAFTATTAGVGEAARGFSCDKPL